MPQRQTTNVVSQDIPTQASLPQPPADHLGWQALLEAHRRLEIEDARTVWHADGFTWRAHCLAQRFRLEGPVTIDGRQTWWGGVETDCLRGAVPVGQGGRSDPSQSHPEGA